MKKNLKKLILLFLFINFCYFSIFSQQVGGGYVIRNDLEQFLGNANIAEKFDNMISPSLQNVKSIGMGRTQVANGKFFNAMNYNPSFLANSKVGFDIPCMSFQIPTATLDAADFIYKNRNQFTNAQFLTDLLDAYNQYENAQNINDKTAAVNKILKALKFPQDLVKKVMGSPSSPNNQSIAIIPAFQAQFGHFGISLYSNANLTFQTKPNLILDQILQIKIPENAQSLSTDAAQNILAVINSAFDASGNVQPGALPKVLNISSVDLVGTVGYGYRINDKLDIGASLKLINRKMSAQIIDPDDFENISNFINKSIKDLNKNSIGITGDLGLTYRKNKITVGFSAQNIIPIKPLKQEVSYNLNRVSIGKPHIAVNNQGHPLVGWYINNQFYPDAAGDTMIYFVTQNKKITSKYELKTPFIATLGVNYPIKDNWDISFDLADILQNDKSYEDFASRIRLGSEYRILNNMFAFRGGFADKHLTAGVGFSIKVFQLDAAYAYDNYIKDNSYYLQIKFGW